MSEHEALTPKTRYALCFEIRYGMRHAERHARLYRRISSIFTFANISLGSTAFAGFVSSSPSLAGIAGAMVAVVSWLDLVIKPGERASCAEFVVRLFSELRADADGIQDDAELRRRVALLQGEPMPGQIESLDLVAFNDVARELGHLDQVEELTRMQRLAKAFA